MKSNSLCAVAALCAIGCLQAGCYNSYRIANEELSTLSSSYIAEQVDVTTDEGTVVQISATSPIQVVTAGGDRHNISPFNFTFDSNGFIAPDYDLLLAPGDVDGARVFEFARGRTIGVIVGSLLLAGGGFAAVSVLAEPKAAQ